MMMARLGYATAGQRAFILAHEYGHQVQRRNRGLVYLDMCPGTSIGNNFNAARELPVPSGGRGTRNILGCIHSGAAQRGNWQTIRNQLGIP